MKSFAYLALAVGRLHAPGLIIAIVIAAAAAFISEHQKGSPLLYALLLGMALKSVLDADSSAPGINFAARTILRTGVALLGLRISVEQVMALGATSALIIVVSVAATIGFGVLLAKRLNYDTPFGLLTGGATAICGASAALAISSLLPRNDNSDRDASFTVVAVTTLATVAMIFFPPAIRALGFSDGAAGYIIGGTIHDVAQVVGAGYMISPHAGDVATVTKLFRVALLIPITLVIAAYYHVPSAKTSRVQVPWFLVLFVIFVAIRSLTPSFEGAVGHSPDAIGWGSAFLRWIAGHTQSIYAGADTVSRWCFTVAIAGVGLKTSLGDFKQFGWQAIALVLAETAFITLVVGGAAFLI